MNHSRNPARLFISVCVVFSLAGFSFAKTTRETLKQTEAEVRQIVQRVIPCTVSIGSARTGGSGSGVIVSKDGLVLTAAHVTQAAGDDLFVMLPDGRELKAKSLGANYNRDAGMVQIVEKGKYPFVELGDANELHADQWCISLGHAGGYQRDRSPPIRIGRILDPNSFMGFIVSDCTLIGGDSGGPMFDLQGRLIGIHSNIGMSLSDNNHVPIAAFQDSWDRLQEGERWGTLMQDGFHGDPERPMLGIRPLEATDEGIRIDVVSGGPAEKAGLEKGDVVKSIGGQETTSVAEVFESVSRNKPGDQVKVVILRGEKEIPLTVKLSRAADVRRGDEESSSEPPKDESDETEDKAKSDDRVRSPEPIKPKELDEKFEDLVQDAIKKGGRLELSPEEFEQFGGIRGFMRRMSKLADELSAEKIAQLMGIRTGDDKFYGEVVAAYRPIISPATKSVVRLMQGKRQIALATVVSADGKVLTKASEIKGRDVELETSDGQRHAVQVQRQFPDYDLALLKADVKLSPVKWHIIDQRLPLGSFLSAVGPDDSSPLAIGVVSVSTRNLSGRDKPYLGIGLEAVEQGILVLEVLDKTSAKKAGLRRGDLITKLDGKSYKTARDFIEAIMANMPGDTVAVTFRRGEAERQINITLGDRSIMPRRDNLSFYPQGGRLSRNRDGYPDALQTDMPIRPRDCGSPVVDLDGRVIGINIARAGRIKSYAIPGKTINQLLATP